MGDQGGLPPRRHARTSTTATRAAAPSCARCSPRTCGGYAPPPPTRSASWSAPGSPRGWASCCRALARPGVRCVALRGSRATETWPDQRQCPGRAGGGRRRGARSRGRARPGRRRAGGERRPGGRRHAGAPVPHRRRARGAAAARPARVGGRNDGFIIEDDYDSEFRYDREPVGVLQGLAPDRVFTIGTVSKSLAPGVRLGWVLVPARAGRRRRGGEADQRPRLVRPGPARGGRAARVRPVRPAPAADARGVWAAARRADRRAGPARARGQADRPGRRASTPWRTCRRRPTSRRSSRRRASVRSACTGWARSGPPPWPRPPQLVLGFGNVSERAIEAGIAAVADLLR